MIKIGTFPVKTRVPLTAWVVAGVVTLFSMVSSLMHVIAASDQTMPVAAQAIPAHHASVN
jgi:hypothetical protein